VKKVPTVANPFDCGVKFVVQIIPVPFCQIPVSKVNYKYVQSGGVVGLLEKRRAYTGVQLEE